MTCHPPATPKHPPPSPACLGGGDPLHARLGAGHAAHQAAHCKHGLAQQRSHAGAQDDHPAEQTGEKQGAKSRGREGNRPSNELERSHMQNNNSAPRPRSSLLTSVQQDLVYPAPSVHTWRATAGRPGGRRRPPRPWTGTEAARAGCPSAHSWGGKTGPQHGTGSCGSA